MRISLPPSVDLPAGGEMSAEEFRALLDRADGTVFVPPVEAGESDWTTSEKKFQQRLADYAAGRGWRGYHTWKSANSSPGFPDFVALRGLRLVVAELKVGDNKPTKDQQWWLDALRALGIGPIEVYLWYPDDWQEIEEVLR